MNEQSNFLQKASGGLSVGSILLATLAAMVEKCKLKHSAISLGSDEPIPLMIKKSTELDFDLFDLIAFLEFSSFA